MLKTLKCLIKRPIQLVCIDFDETLLTINTYGEWKIDALELNDYVRIDLITFIKHCLKNKKYVAIVSYSSQYNVIYKCLESFLNDDIKKIYIKTGNQFNKCDKIYCKSLQKKKKIKMKRKNPMILSVCTEIFQKNKIKILPKQVLLIDNDWNNIKLAKQGGFNTYHFNKNSQNIFLDKLQNNIEHFLNKSSYTFIFADACKLILVIILLLFLFFTKKSNIGTKLITYKIK